MYHRIDNRASLPPAWGYSSEFFTLGPHVVPDGPCQGVTHYPHLSFELPFFQMVMIAARFFKKLRSRSIDESAWDYSRRPLQTHGLRLMWHAIEGSPQAVDIYLRRFLAGCVLKQVANDTNLRWPRQKDSGEWKDRLICEGFTDPDAVFAIIEPIGYPFFLPYARSPTSVQLARAVHHLPDDDPTRAPYAAIFFYLFGHEVDSRKALTCIIPRRFNNCLYWAHMR